MKLVRFQLQTNIDASDLKNHSKYICLDCRCDLDDYIIRGSTVTSASGSVHSLKHYVNCNTKNVIYAITCTLCRKQYVGQTITKLRERLNQHTSSIRRKNKKLPVAVHFNEPGHSIDHFAFQGVEVVSDVTQLNRIESLWMWTLKAHRSTGGLNNSEPFIIPFTPNS